MTIDHMRWGNICRTGWFCLPYFPCMCIVCFTFPVWCLAATLLIVDTFVKVWSDSWHELVLCLPVHLAHFSSEFGQLVAMWFVNLWHCKQCQGSRKNFHMNTFFTPIYLSFQMRMFAATGLLRAMYACVTVCPLSLHSINLIRALSEMLFSSRLLCPAMQQILLIEGSKEAVGDKFGNYIEGLSVHLSCPLQTHFFHNPSAYIWVRHTPDCLSRHSKWHYCPIGASGFLLFCWLMKCLGHHWWSW